MYPKVRLLNDEERNLLRNIALDEFQADIRNDERYARETVEYLADNQSDQWWAEFLSSDPNIVKYLLGFNPFEK